MGNLIDFAIYNPGILKDSDFLAGFVARQELTENLMGRLRETKRDGVAEHHLVLGQRGMGKTSLLRRLALGVRDDEALSKVLLPLTFREEQYNVHNLHVFWCNCLDTLGDWFERTGQAEKASEIDCEVAGLCKGSPDPSGAEPHAAFARWMKREKRRALLLLDNLDLILDGLSQHDWAFRRALQERGGVVVVGASTHYLEAIAKPEAAFHDFFQVTLLEKLSHGEMTACLRRLAAARGDAGKPVTRVLDEDPGRVRTLYDLTGGNPRTLVLLYLLLESDGGDDVMVDLERLLDQVTVFYKARVEDLPAQARVVLDAVALHWDPVTAAKVAEATGLEIQAVSSQLDRLIKAGVLEKVDVSTTTRSAFQLGERFFNIWYLMRHGPRRQRARLRWLTGFLAGFYTPEQLEQKAWRALRTGQEEGPDRALYYLALSDTISKAFLRQLLEYVALLAFVRNATDTGRPLVELLDLGEFHIPKDATQWALLATLLAMLGRNNEARVAFRQASNIDAIHAGEVVDIVTDSFARARYLKAANITSRIMSAAADVVGERYMDRLGALREAEIEFRSALVLDDTNFRAMSNLLMLLLSIPSRSKDAGALFDSTIDKVQPVTVLLLKAYRAIAISNPSEALACLSTIFERPDQELFNIHWNALLRTLRFAASRGCAEQILALMDENGVAERLWPLWAAYDAFVRGSERLRDINPEARGAAEEILKSLTPFPSPEQPSAKSRTTTPKNRRTKKLDTGRNGAKKSKR